MRDTWPFADRAGVRVGGAVLGDVPPGKQVPQLHPHADERRQETGMMMMRVYRNVKLLHHQEDANEVHLFSPTGDDPEAELDGSPVLNVL